MSRADSDHDGAPDLPDRSISRTGSSSDSTPDDVLAPKSGAKGDDSPARDLGDDDLDAAPVIEDSGHYSKSPAPKSDEGATRGVNRGRKSKIDQYRERRDAARRAQTAGIRGLAGRIGDRVSDATFGRVNRFGQRIGEQSVHRFADMTIGALPIVGKRARRMGGGDVVTGLSNLAVRNPIYAFLLARIPVEGPARSGVNCACGCVAGCGCVGGPSCACGIPVMTCALPFAIIFFIILLIGVNITNQPNFAPERFCQAYGNTACTAGGVQLGAVLSEVKPQDIVAYQALEEQYHVPWFYIAAWDKIASNYGKVATRPSADTEAPAQAILIARLALEKRIDELYPELKGLPSPYEPNTDGSGDATPLPDDGVPDETPDPADGVPLGPDVPSAVPTITPATTPRPSGPAGPTAAPTLSPALQASYDEANALRAELETAISALQSDARSGSFGPFLVNRAEYERYGNKDSSDPANPALDPFDPKDAAAIIVRHMVDDYNESLRFTGTLRFPGVPLEATLDPRMPDYIRANTTSQATYFTQLVQQAAGYNFGFFFGPSDTWPDGPRKGQKVTLAERYYMCVNLPVDQALCKTFVSNANEIPVTSGPDFAAMVAAYYDPNQPVGEQIKDYAQLQVLMGSLLSDDQMWGMEHQAVFNVPVVSAGGRLTGDDAQTNAYAQAINSYAMALYSAWVADQQVNDESSGLNGVSTIDKVELGFWKGAIDQVSKETKIPWQYLAATLRADGAFSCKSVAPSNVIKGDRLARILAGTDTSFSYKGIGIYAGQYLTGTNPTGMQACWRFGAVRATRWGSIHSDRPTVAMNFCTYGFRYANSTDDNCGTATISMLDPKGNLKTITADIVDFCDCFTGVLTKDMAIETAHNTEKGVDLNDRALQALGWSSGFPGVRDAVVTINPPSHPVRWSSTIEGMVPVSAAAAKAMIEGTNTASDPVRVQVVQAMAARLLAGAGLNAGAVPNMADMWRAWQSFSGCALSSAQVPIPDPLKPGSTLGSSGTCTFIKAATNYTLSYYNATSAGGATGTRGTPKFITERNEYLRYNGYFYDCTYTAALMAANKAVNNRIDVSSKRKVADIVLEMRDYTNDALGTGSNPRDNIYPGFKHMFGIEFPYSGNGVRMNWGELKSWLNSGHGAVILGVYANMSDRYTRFDPNFARKGQASTHAMYVDRRDASTGMIWLMDPLGSGSYQGEWVPDAEIRNFLRGMQWSDEQLYLILADDMKTGDKLPAVTTP